MGIGWLIIRLFIPRRKGGQQATQFFIVELQLAKEYFLTSDRVARLGVLLLHLLHLLSQLGLLGLGLVHLLHHADDGCCHDILDIVNCQ